MEEMDNALKKLVSDYDDQKTARNWNQITSEMNHLFALDMTKKQYSKFFDLLQIKKFLSHPL